MFSLHFQANNNYKSVNDHISLMPFSPFPVCPGKEGNKCHHNFYHIWGPFSLQHVRAVPQLLAHLSSF